MKATLSRLHGSTRRGIALLTVLALLTLTAPKKNAAKPQGEWNHFHIVNQSDKLTVKLNGEVMNEMDLTKAPLASRPKERPTGFQGHSLPVWLKDIRIREL